MEKRTDGKGERRVGHAIVAVSGEQDSTKQVLQVLRCRPLLGSRVEISH